MRDAGNQPIGCGHDLRLYLISVEETRTGLADTESGGVLSDAVLCLGSGSSNYKCTWLTA